MSFNTILERLFEYRFIFIFIFLLAGGLILGMIFDLLFQRMMKKISKRSKLLSDGNLIRSFKGIFIIIFLLSGAYIGTVISPIPHDIIEYIKKGLGVMFILAATFICARFINIILLEILVKRKVIASTNTIFSTIIKIVILFIGILIGLQYLNISILPIITALGVGGVAVALALQETLSNFFAGIQIIASGQFKAGQYIRLDNGEEGYIQDINWRYTIIRTLPNNIIVVPNAKLATGIVTNYHNPDKELAVLVKVGVGYSSDLEKVEKVTIDVAKDIMKSVKGGVPGFEPFIRYSGFSDFSVNFTVILRATEYVDQYLIKHEFIKRLHTRYKKEGIEIPYPTRTIHMVKE